MPFFRKPGHTQTHPLKRAAAIDGIRLWAESSGTHFSHGRYSNVRPELDPTFLHADPPDIAPHRDTVAETIRAELTAAEHVGIAIMHHLPDDQWAALKTWLDGHSA